MKNVRILYTIWNILRPCGILHDRLVYLVWVNLVYSFPFWYVWTKKNLATLGCIRLTEIKRSLSWSVKANLGRTWIC
jgi:hypothetical protein